VFQKICPLLNCLGLQLEETCTNIHIFVIILVSQSIYNFASNLMLTYFTLQFFRLAETTRHYYVCKHVDQ